MQIKNNPAYSIYIGAKKNPYLVFNYQDGIGIFYFGKGDNEQKMRVGIINVLKNSWKTMLMVNKLTAAITKKAT